MKSQEVDKVVDKLYQLQHSIRAIREAYEDVDELPRHLREAEFELLCGIDAVKNSEDEKKEEENERAFLPRHSTQT